MIIDIINKVKLHLNRAKSALNEIKEWQKIDETIFTDFEKVKTIDTFIYRFSKIQDLMGQKLFKVFINELGEYRENMSLIDILDKLEKFEILEDANQWREYRNIRNILTHEYPNNEKEVADGISISIDAFAEIENILYKIENYLKDRSLI
jgi:hypothetical protein